MLTDEDYGPKAASERRCAALREDARGWADNGERGKRWIVACATGQRDVIPGTRWRDSVTDSEWEVAELSGDARVYSPSGMGGTPIFWCRCVDWTPRAEDEYRKYARADGCVQFCGDSIALQAY